MQDWNKQGLNVSRLFFIFFFLLWKETKLKKLLTGDIVDTKKLIYSSIRTTIQSEMASCYKGKLALRVQIHHKLFWCKVYFLFSA